MFYVPHCGEGKEIGGTGIGTALGERRFQSSCFLYWEEAVVHQGRGTLGEKKKTVGGRGGEEELGNGDWDRRVLGAGSDKRVGTQPGGEP